MARLRKNQNTSKQNKHLDGIPASDAVEYLSGVLPEMIQLAERAGLDLVAYLLKMADDAAREEAATAKRTGR
ncbi:hypothetical protein [Microbaculum marinum]|uniref:Uncharacterized protein n=1 Tax=Microbaculum marinum TaxID=1764581 RepID=A0AAW9RWY3_9HYPH